jgi:hypothetical protein
LTKILVITILLTYLCLSGKNLDIRLRHISYCRGSYDVLPNIIELLSTCWVR